jgi:two-component system chemotaxis sensor kinase CheA
MIDKFKEKFVDEALDNVRDLEEALLQLEEDNQNKELIERIFRAMHSLKGGGAMFGFNDLSEFTHHLETLFDLVRTGKLEVSNTIITLTLSAIDHIKHLLQVGDLSDAAELNYQKELISKVQNVLSPETLKKNSGSAAIEINDDGSKTYLITFEPNHDILKNGTNPLYLLDDLHAFGNAVSIPFFNNIPEFSQLDPVLNYCNWQVVLNTESSSNDIKDVFIFVEDECKIDIAEICKGDITNHPAFIEMVDEHKGNQTPLDIISLKAIGKSAPEVISDDASKKKAVLKEHKISSIRVASNKVDELVTLVSELVTIQAQLTLFAEKSGDQQITSLAENIQKLSRQLRDNAFEISLIPLQNELMRFQRLVRDLSKDLEKEIDFVIEGGEIELDKNIIENLTDPLLHIIRNSVDHGIEMPDERIKKGKSPKGTIFFKAFYSGASVVIKVSDDGKGIDTDFIKKRAIEKGIIDKSLDLNKKEIFDLLFVSGFTTKDVVSDLSGRGVGMDVVKRKISDIRGEVSIDSEVNIGTTTTLELPLTLSIIDGLLLKVGENNYVIPISSIDKIHQLTDAKTGSTLNHIITVDNKQYNYVDLREIFETDNSLNGTEQLILTKYEDKLVGIVVDQVIGEYQTVVKPLGRYLRSHETLSGASIMGDGSIAFVIDTNRLIHYHSFRRFKTKNQ